MAACGVPIGAMTPNQRLVSKSGMPASAIDGTSGSALARLFDAVASALSFPAVICPITVEAGEKNIVILSEDKASNIAKLPELLQKP